MICPQNMKSKKSLLRKYFLACPEEERAIQAAEKFKLKNPSFMGISQLHNMVSFYT